MKKRAVLGLLLGAGCIFFATRAVDPSEIWSAFSSVRWTVLVPVALIFLVQQMLRAWRQLLLVQPVAPTARYVTQLGVLCMSFFCINSLPVRLGELVRPWLLQRKEGLELGAGFAVVVLERVIDLTATLALLGCALWLSELPSARAEGWGASVDLEVLARSVCLWVILPAVSLLTLLVFGGEKVAGWMARALPDSRWQVSLSGLLESFVRAVRGVGSPRRLVLIVAVTGVTWAGTAEMIRMLADAASLGSWIGYPEALGVLALTMLSTALPAPPGFIGVYEAGALAALALFGVPSEMLLAEGLAFALVLHWWIYLVQAASAAGFFLVDEVGLYELLAGVRRSQSP